VEEDNEEVMRRGKDGATLDEVEPASWVRVSRGVVFTHWVTWLKFGKWAMSR
jgi:hypothetical protein